MARQATIYQWAKFTPLAVYTSLAFIIASTGIIFYVYTKHRTGKINLASAIPSFSALFVFFLTLLLWRAFLQEEIESIQGLVNSESEKVQDRIQVQIQDRISELEELKFQWQLFPTVPQEIWLRSAEFYRKNGVSPVGWTTRGPK